MPARECRVLPPPPPSIFEKDEMSLFPDRLFGRVFSVNKRLLVMSGALPLREGMEAPFLLFSAKQCWLGVKYRKLVQCIKGEWQQQWEGLAWQQGYTPTPSAKPLVSVLVLLGMGSCSHRAVSIN